MPISPCPDLQIDLRHKANQQWENISYRTWSIPYIQHARLGQFRIDMESAKQRQGTLPILKIDMGQCEYPHQEPQSIPLQDGAWSAAGARTNRDVLTLNPKEPRLFRNSESSQVHEDRCVESGERI